MTPYKENKVLTEDAEADYADFLVYSRDRGCSCCISPPCNWCVHPGNPHNLVECDDCWVDEDVIGSACDNAMERIRRMIDEVAEQQIAEHNKQFNKYSNTGV